MLDEANTAEEVEENVEETTEEVVEETPETLEEVPSEDIEEALSEEENLLLGKFKSQDELIKAYSNLESEASRMAQQLRATSVNQPKQELTDEQKQIQEFISQNNLMTKSQFQQLMADQNDLQHLKSNGVSPKQLKVVQDLSKTKGTTDSGIPYYQATLQEIYEDVYGTMDQKRVVGKKVVGVKPKPGAKKSNRLTREAIAKMSPEEYTKNKDEILRMAKSGELK